MRQFPASNTYAMCFWVMLLSPILAFNANAQIEVQSSKTAPGEDFSFVCNNFWNDVPQIFDSKKENRFLIDSKFPERLVTVENSKKFINGLNTSFVMYPGEKLVVGRKNGDVTMTSVGRPERDHELNFFVQLNKEVGQFEGFMVDVYPKGSSIEKKLDIEDEKYSRRTAFLNSYVKSNPVSPKFLAYMESSFLYKMLSRKYALLNLANELSDSIATRYSEFKFPFSDEFYFLHEYRGATSSFFYFKRGKGKCNDCYEELLSEAGKVFTPKTMDVFALGVMKRAEKDNYSRLSDLANACIRIVGDPEISDRIKTNYIVNNSDKLMTDMLSSNPEQMINLAGESITLAELIKSKQDSIVYVDFWASWCAPCREAMPASHEVKAALKYKKVSMVYISIDDNVKAWQLASVKEMLNKKPDNYLLVNRKNSEFLKSNDISSIPRYLIFDKTGRLIYRNAPRVNEKEIVSLLTKLADKP